MGNIYTYVVEHHDQPAVGARTIINGGKLNAIMFDDALARLERTEDFINKLRGETSCNHTKDAIDEFFGVGA